jgi:hypothetical protein
MPRRFGFVPVEEARRGGGLRVRDLRRPDGWGWGRGVEAVGCARPRQSAVAVTTIRPDATMRPTGARSHARWSAVEAARNECHTIRREVLRHARRQARPLAH